MMFLLSFSRASVLTWIALACVISIARCQASAGPTPTGEHDPSGRRCSRDPGLTIPTTNNPVLFSSYLAACTGPPTWHIRGRSLVAGHRPHFPRCSLPFGPAQMDRFLTAANSWLSRVARSSVLPSSPTARSCPCHSTARLLDPDAGCYETSCCFG